MTEEEWERSRDKRVSNWRDFSKKKFVVGSKKSDGAIRPPTVKPESRPHYTVVEEKKINLWYGRKETALIFAGNDDMDILLI